MTRTPDAARHPWEHLSDEDLLLHLDGELSPADARRAAAHVAGCATCAARADALRDTSAVLVEAVRGVPVPASLERPRWRDGAADAEATSRVVRRRPGRAAIGAGLLVAGALALAAQPVARRLGGLLRPASDEAAGAIERPGTPPGETAIRFAPRGGRLVVEVASALAGDSVRLQPTAAPDVTVRVPSGSGAAVWSMPDGVRLSHARGGRATYTVEVAPGVTTVQVRSAGRTVAVTRARVAAEGGVALSVAPR